MNINSVEGANSPRTHQKIARTTPEQLVKAEQHAEPLVRRMNLETLEVATQGMEVSDDQQLADANDILRELKLGRDQWVGYWAPIKQQAWATHRLLCDSEKKVLVRIDRLVTQVKAAMRPYVNELERVEAERQRSINEEVERQRLAAQAEAERLAKRGQIAQAEQLREQADAIVAPVVTSEPLDLGGTTIRKDWKVEVFDPLRFIKAIADGHAPIEVIKEFNLALLRRMAAERGGLDFPGVKAEQVTGFAVYR